MGLQEFRKTVRRTLLITLPGVAGAAVAQPAPIAAPDAMPPARAGFERMIDQALARSATAEASADLRGTGAYPATMEVDLALPNATIYRPADLDRLGRRKLGLMVWGNGGCSNDGASARAHLAEVASHGYLVIAPGRPLTGPLALPGAPEPRPMQSTIQDLRGALDWALAENGRPGSPYYRRIDPATVAAAGHSCGAMQAILLADDRRIRTLIVHNSGIVPILPDNPPLVMHSERLRGVRQPTLIILGGEGDVIWKYGLQTFDQLDRAPVMLASRDTGHGGMFGQPHGGEVAALAVKWLDWRLRGDKSASTPFAGPGCGLCRDPAWTVRKKGMR
jgi:hypothetical protein